MNLTKIILLMSFTHLNYIGCTSQSQTTMTTTSISNCGRILEKGAIKSFNLFTSTTYRGEFPWHVAVYRREKYGSRQYICSGVLINSHTIVTTAHCLYGEYGIISYDAIVVSLGKYDIDISTLNTEEMHVAQTVIHEKFDRFNLEHDIAIIKMASNTTFTNFIQPICIANELPPSENGYGVVVGWGHNRYRATENLLTKGKITLEAAAQCRKNNEELFVNLLHGNKMCGRYELGTDLCSGDSGSGLFVEHNGQWFLRGIYSLGISQTNRMHCDAAQLLLFTDVFNYYQWIVDNLKCHGHES